MLDRHVIDAFKRATPAQRRIFVWLLVFGFVFANASAFEDIVQAASELAAALQFEDAAR